MTPAIRSLLDAILGIVAIAMVASFYAYMLFGVTGIWMALGFIVAALGATLIAQLLA